MMVRAKLSALQEGNWREYAVRFALGGLATVLAGGVAQIFGPQVGGLFLAFPAIFCASATLIETHECRRKAEKKLRGEKRGKDAAALDAAGAGIGSAGLAAFGLVTWLCARESALLALVLASGAWFVVAVLLWRVRMHLRVLRR
jgi:hypothetical protein